MNKIGRSKIDWPFDNLYAWNIVIGCPRGCFNENCWALKINEKLKNIEEKTGRKTLESIWGKTCLKNICI